MQSSVNNPPKTRNLRIPPAGIFKPVTTSTSTATSGPSNIALFLANLRLLDLDLREDWPEISAKTFSTKDAQQNQKRRIQSVEWSLYQLFALWDPEEAQNKLQPFFPPIEPLQSLNLRAALFRCLDHAKKTGVLGRDTVLRKTMLDECKGERLEEVLAVFSNAVLKKVLQEEQNSSELETIAQQLAYENFSYTGERSVLSALILAHKASVTTHLREKDNSRAKYNDFSELLKLNERRIHRRHEQLKEAMAESEGYLKLPPSEVGSWQNQVQKNWSGSEDWLGTILYGDSKVGEEGLLATPFEKVWKHVTRGSIGDIESQGRVGLLEQLDMRVKNQENRFARWKDFSNSLSTKSGDTLDAKTTGPLPGKKIDLGFNLHQTIRVGESNLKESSSMKGPFFDDYTQLIEAMTREIAAIKDPSRQTVAPTKRPPACDDASPTPVPSPYHTDVGPQDDDEWLSASELEESSPGFSAHVSKSLSRTPPSETHLQSSRQEEIKDEINNSSEVAENSNTDENPWEQSGNVAETNVSGAESSPEEEEATLVPTEPPYSVNRALSPSPLPDFQTPPRHPSPEPEEQTEIALADEILNSMSAASPSPKKPRHTLSLAERTRMSMSRKSHAQISELHDFDDVQEAPRLSIKPRPSLAPQPLNEESDLHAGLIERTRKSMAGFEAAQKKAQIQRRRSVKDAKKKQKESSYFPRVNEEVEVPDVSAVELMDGADPDYESVFKSRPKIKTSPAVSPTRSRIEEEDEG
ncbi:hypothetical protein GLAREA_12545 [Glarea lozoyensis ATCC 20868]|uniref:HAUS augmin-like complex subunit 6 N-terminal domain-containing protein n=1 Tax=Glarea lozoyensis (strain ATCC 20868 / MF5171) TaxID=1116229 RepID=S3CY60_GLAL2|nr:uncharacterized protein GLAREA_12545 [Glarea lozoyensis ATCC 20868]EPE31242.1 hypothetical protein GLAREA_12545 [Glarea lozoyensis ATCC 20868]